MGVSCEPPLRVFVHDTGEVFYSHLCGSVSHEGVGLGLLLLGGFALPPTERLGEGL